MGALSFVRNVYDLDTLDTRFTNSASVPYQTVIDARSDPATSNGTTSKWQGKAQRSKWNTPEFYIYYLILGFAIPYMFWVVFDVSRRMWLLPTAECTNCSRALR